MGDWIILVPVLVGFVALAALYAFDKLRKPRREIFVGFDFSDPVGGAAVVMERHPRTGCLTIIGHHSIPAATYDFERIAWDTPDSPYGFVDANTVDVRKLMGPFERWGFGG